MQRNVKIIKLLFQVENNKYIYLKIILSIMKKITTKEAKYYVYLMLVVHKAISINFYEKNKQIYISFNKNISILSMFKRE